MSEVELSNHKGREKFPLPLWERIEERVIAEGAGHWMGEDALLKAMRDFE